MATWQLQIRNPQFDADDLKRFVEDLEHEAQPDDVIVRAKIKNTLPEEIAIIIEGQGAVSNFPSGATYEIVALGKKDNPLQIDIIDIGIVVYADKWGAIFENGVTTDAY